MAIKVEEKKWILYRHTSNFEVIKMLALDIKNHQSNVSKSDEYYLKRRLELLNLYRSRNNMSRQLSTISNKIKTLSFWMFGYKEKINDKVKFIFSPLGNLFLKHIDDTDKSKKIFLSMLFAMQFEHPNSTTDPLFNIYPFRLIIKLLLDERLDFKIYDDEYTILIPFLSDINESIYEDLINKILCLRKLNKYDKINILKNNEHTYVNSYYEWQFTKTLFDQIGLIYKTDGEKICELYHPVNENSNSSATKRIIKNSYIKLSNDIVDFSKILLTQYSVFKKPYKLNDPNTLYSDTVKAIYNFYPIELLKEINEEVNLFDSVMKIPSLIEEYSNNNSNEQAYLFENILVDAFNLFTNVTAIGIGGADNTDIECQYLVDNTKFAVEAKSTSNKLNQINSGRLKHHRLKLGGKYTIVVTPRYVPAALRDILGTEICIIKANTLTEFLYNSLLFDPRNMDYTDIHNIVLSNFGKDISKQISDLTFSKFAI